MGFNDIGDHVKLKKFSLLIFSPKMYDIILEVEWFSKYNFGLFSSIDHTCMVCICNNFGMSRLGCGQYKFEDAKIN